MFDPLFKVHTIVGIALNGFLKMTSTVCILFAAISTPPVVPDCVLLFYYQYQHRICKSRISVLGDPKA